MEMLLLCGPHFKHHFLKARVTYVHEVLLHVMGEVLQHRHLTDELFGGICGRENRALAKLCIIVNCSKEQGEKKKKQEKSVTVLRFL